MLCTTVGRYEDQREFVLSTFRETRYGLYRLLSSLTNRSIDHTHTHIHSSTDAISDVPSLSLENWMGFPFHAPLDPLKTYEDLSSSSLPFVLKPSSPSKTLLLDGTDPTIYVTSSSVPVMMTEQGNTECYDELILEGVTEYAFVSPFLSDTKSIIFSDVRPGDVVSWCSPWSHRSTSLSSKVMTYRVTNPSSAAYRSSFSDVSACSLRRPEALLLESSSHQDSRLDSFYSSSISDTKTLLGSKTSDEIHFHHGLWTDETSTYVSVRAREFFLIISHFHVSIILAHIARKSLERKKKS